MKKLLCLLIACLALSSAAEHAPLPAYWPTPAFKLTDQDNQPRSDADLRGKTWLVDFVFTRCGGPCPMMTQKMVELAKAIPSPDVRFVSISVDPTYDTPPILKQYARVQGATDPRFLFLTGQADVIYDLAKQGFKVTALPARGDDPIIHDERILLVDGSGTVRGFYHTRDDGAMARLVSDARFVAGAAQADTVRANPLLARFPAINASLNATSGILLCLAMMMIQARRVRMHAALMIAAVISSAAFLGCYVTYHYLKLQTGVGVTRFPESSYKPVYYAILISHTILAVVILPLIFMTLTRAARRKWDAHRRIAKPTFWLWLYVSATGVLVYWMLYHLAPRLAVVS